MTEPHKQDFRQIIVDLEAKGITTYKLATMMHVQYIQIQRMKKTGRVHHYEGEMLLAIHAQYCGEAITTVSVCSTPKAQ